VLDIVLRDTPGPEVLLTLFFEQTASSRAKGIEFLKRLGQRTADRDDFPDLATRDAQLTAIFTWGIPDDTRLRRLACIEQPVLAANGDNDAMVPTKNSYLMAEHLLNARLSIYPDAGHGFLFQYPVDFGTEVNAFLGH
jgi:pimeloyl-ACP methyl ester carboxylesterase